jgi:hypothetical protein
MAAVAASCRQNAGRYCGADAGAAGAAGVAPAPLSPGSV